MTTTIERKPRTHTAKGRPFKHGRGGYVNHKCGCEVCVEANRAYTLKTWHHREENGGARTIYDLACQWCGEGFKGRQDARYCSTSCKSVALTLKGPALPPPPPREAYMAELLEAGEWGQVKARLLERTTRVGECMEWTGRVSKDGYPTTQVGGRRLPVHRLMLQAKHEGRPLGVLHSHHVCANIRCVNPDHLQPVTARDNMAEMLARQSYLARIQELEEAIREMSPDHEVLHRVPVDGG